MNLASFLKRGLHKKILGKSGEPGLVNKSSKDEMKIRPFVHKLKSQLASSCDSNFFEAICLISEQYRHHYKFRALTETGNKIILLSAGRK